VLLIGALFPLGKIVATTGALNMLVVAGQDPGELLDRHVSGDWGEIPPEDAGENRFSVEHGFRIISSYPVGSAGERIWVITEADRSSTCILLPEEY
jgi:glycine cleavage system aminomethyltransferase T